MTLNYKTPPHAHVVYCNKNVTLNKLFTMKRFERPLSPLATSTWATVNRCIHDSSFISKPEIVFPEFGTMELDWPLHTEPPRLQPPSNTSGMIWNTSCEPGLLTRHPARPHARNWITSLQPVSKCLWRAFPEVWRLVCSQQHINSHGFLMRCSTITYGCNIYLWHPLGLVVV